MLISQNFYKCNKLYVNMGDQESAYTIESAHLAADDVNSRGFPFALPCASPSFYKTRFTLIRSN